MTKRTRKRVSSPVLQDRLNDIAGQLLDAVPDKLDDASLQEIARMLGVVLDRIGSAAEAAGDEPVDIEDLRARLARLIEKKSRPTAD